MSRTVNSQPTYWPIYLSFSAALFYAVVPLTGWVNKLMPNLVLMVLIYWSIYRSDLVGLGFAWTVGLIHDGISASLLGQHALIYVIVVFILNTGPIKTKNYAFLEYLTWIILFIIFDILMSVFFNVIIRQNSINWSVIYSIIGCIFIWPWLYVMLNYFETIVANRR